MQTSAAMTPTLRKLNLTAHVVFSVGFLGAVASFLALSIAGLTSQDAETVRGAYLSMNLIGQFVIVPLCFSALLTGVVQSLGTEWGLFRYYWVLLKLILTVGSTVLLLVHQFMAVARAARLVSAAAGTMPSVGHLGTELLTKAGLAIVVLIVITTISIYKPWGLTPYGRRKKFLQLPEKKTSIGLKVSLAVIGVLLVVAFIAEHLTGHSLGHHIH
jgi:hypothetical protein